MKKIAILAALLLLSFSISCLAQTDSAASSEQTMMRPDASTVYKDEQGNKITRAQFGKYIMQQDVYTMLPEINNGKIISLQIKKKDKSIATGSVAKDFKGTLTDGSTLSLSQLKGKIVVLNFWFTGCHPCAMEMPELSALADKYKQDTDVVFIAVTFDDKAQVNKFLTKNKFTYKQVTNAKDICDAYQIIAFPQHIVTDKEGKVYDIQQGFASGIGEKLDTTIQHIKNEKPLASQDKQEAQTQISFDANTIIEDEQGKRLDMSKAAALINSGSYLPDMTQRDGKSVLVLRKKG